MNPNKTKIFLFFIAGAIAGMLVTYFLVNYKIEKKQPETTYVSTAESQQSDTSTDFRRNKPANSGANLSEIDRLTNEEVIIDYVKKNGRLPDYYITKTEARNQGWVPSKGNLCDVLPGRAIGGDKFSNREKTLPKGEQYYEADVNYNCGKRNADRIVFTTKGDVWLTHDHYKSFDKQ
ncbi:ribonuclease N [Chryseobacterium taklimakanense]|uniref:ribonuclease domain-containing protein n=1 Tax=Chryseobacterium taklimakanense TaxID=536441 RepID=UPI001EF5D365|nr:ribonuclease domain-containing protein [Chryseobacterium taklimakanense]MCG7280334.1 ribonuclease N [Chryseobacterium taklimakanense]